jgi:hypothetical protein
MAILRRIMASNFGFTAIFQKNKRTQLVGLWRASAPASAFGASVSAIFSTGISAPQTQPAVSFWRLKRFSAVEPIRTQYNGSIHARPNPIGTQIIPDLLAIKVREKMAKWFWSFIITAAHICMVRSFLPL